MEIVATKESSTILVLTWHRGISCLLRAQPYFNVSAIIKRVSTKARDNTSSGCWATSRHPNFAVAPYLTSALGRILLLPGVNGGENSLYLSGRDVDCVGG